MKPQMSGSAPRAAKPSRLSLSSLRCAAAVTSTAESVARQLRGLLVLAVVFLFLPLEPEKLFAQQAQPGDQGWSQHDHYIGQYASSQQWDDAQQPDAQWPYADSGQEYPERSYGQAPSSAQPLNALQLEQLVAPIALYPDTLVAQILAASTYPDQVADADRWLQTEGFTSSEQIVAGADFQNWDPSVKALTAFPRVLAQMDRNLQWTTDLGNAYYNQSQDLLEAIQVMRQRAQSAGTLQSTPQQTVQHDQGYLQLMPVNPQVVYVPTYNPWTVYGEQVSPYPGFSSLGAEQSFPGSSPLNYGLGMVMSAFSQTPWGWLAWGLNWLAQSVLFQQSDYSSHSTTVADRGFRHGVLHAYAGRGAFARQNYGRSPDGYRRFGGGYNGNRGQGIDRSPDGYRRFGGGYNGNRGQGIGRSLDGYRRFGGGYNGNRGQGVGHSQERYAHNWRGGSNSGFHAFGSGYDRAPRQPYNHFQASASRQQFDRGYGSSLRRWTGEGNRGGTGAPYYRSMPGYPAQSSGFQRAQFGGRSTGAFASRDFAHSAKPAHSGGLHLFGGGGHAPKNVSSRGSGAFHMGGGGHAPKGFHGGGKSFSGGHSHGGGGHSSGHGGKHHH